MKKAFLLDIDGTLVASNDAHAQAWVDALQHYGHTITYEEVRVLIGMGGDRLLPAVVPELPEDKHKEVTEYRRNYFLKTFVSQLQPTNGSRMFIESLIQKNIALIVATSASSEELHSLLRAANVDDLLHTFITASEVAESKPAKDIIVAALEKVQAEPKEVFMVGDTPFDIAAAKKAGVQTIALRSGGFSDAQLVGAYRIYDDPASLVVELPTLLHA